MKYIYESTDWSESEDGVEGISYFSEVPASHWEVRVYTTNGEVHGCIIVNTDTSDYLQFGSVFHFFEPTKKMVREAKRAYYHKEFNRLIPLTDIRLK